MQYLFCTLAVTPYLIKNNINTKELCDVFIVVQGAFLIQAVLLYWMLWFICVVKYCLTCFGWTGPYKNIRFTILECLVSLLAGFVCCF